MTTNLRKLDLPRLRQLTLALVLLLAPLLSLAPPTPALAATPGTVVAWGYNAYGQSTIPAGLNGVTAIAGGVFHSLALKSDGTVVAWGDNGAGQTDIPAGLSGVTAIAAGSDHSLALKSDGTVVGWGANCCVPGGLSGVIAIAGGYSFSLALKSDGTIVAWGNNSYGQLNIPAGLSGVTAITAGNYHSLALKSDGTVVAWGNNSYGQLNIPAGLSGVTAITAGNYHSLALKSDGTVVAWGHNGDGQLNIPAGVSSVTAIAGGGNHSLALKSAPGGLPTVVAWGDNGFGQSTIPAGLSGVTAIAGGGNHSLALVLLDTLIDSGPSNPSVTGDASFTFHANVATSTFACKLDSGSFTPCTSPKSYSGMADGLHTFQVQAIDPVGNADSTPASYTWRVDLTAPETTINAGPPNPSFDPMALFFFTGSDASGIARFECALDGATWTPCISPLHTGGGDGTHTFQVQATDAAGNVDATPASYTWVIDLLPPETTITAQPPDPSPSADATFEFNGADSASGIAAFVCTLDGGTAVACTSPQSYSGLSNGSHTFSVYAVDNTGKSDATPASYTWTINTTVPDTTPPDTTIDSAPADPSTSASFAFSSNEAGSSFACQLDGGSFGPCTSPQSYSGLSDGSHTFAVQATDAAGNLDPTPASYTWTINMAPPPQTLSQQVQGVRTSLAALLPSGNSQTDKALHKAIAKLDQGLASDLWQPDGNHLTLKGEMAYHRLRDAVKELVKIKNPSQAVVDAVNTLVTISRTLAQIALNEAVATGGNAAKLAKAQKELNKGDQDRNKGKAANAISHYEEAWEYAQQAVGHSVLAASDPADPDAASAEEAHVHSEEAEAQSHTLF